MPLDVQNLGKYLTGELSIYDDQFVQLPDEDLWTLDGTIIPSRGDLPLGIEELSSYQKQVFGEAAIYDGRAYDIPLVDLGVAGTKIKGFLVMAGAEWSIVDVSRNQIESQIRILPRYSLTEGKMEAVNIAINRRLHRLILAGVPAMGIFGMFNSNRVVATDATTIQPLGMTPTALYNWVKGLVASFKISSKLPYNRIEMYVDDDLYTALTVPLGDNTGDNPYLRLTSQERGQFLASIQPITELSPATLLELGVETVANRGRLILGSFTEGSVVRHFLPIDRTDPFQKDSGIHFGVTGWAGSTEVNFKNPDHFQYVRYNSTKPV